MDMLRKLKPSFPSSDLLEQQSGEILELLIELNTRYQEQQHHSHPLQYYTITKFYPTIHPDIISILKSNNWKVYTYILPDSRHMHVLVISYVDKSQLGHNINPNNLQEIHL